MALGGEAVLVLDMARLRTIRAAGSALGEIAGELPSVFKREWGLVPPALVRPRGAQCRRR